MTSEQAERDLQICFVHVPKAAGISLDELLSRKIRPERRLRVHLGKELTPFDFRHFDFIIGHGQHSDFTRFRSRDRILLTMVRRPEARIDSWFRFIQQRPYLYEYERASKMSAEEFAHECSWTHNYHARMLCDDLYLPTRKVLDPELALRRLKEDYGYVGVQERFEESIELLAYVLGWPPFQTIQHLNKSAIRSSGIDPAMVVAVKEHNGIDLMLYEESVALFEKSYTAMKRDSMRALFGDFGSPILRAEASGQTEAERLRQETDDLYQSCVALRKTIDAKAMEHQKTMDQMTARAADPISEERHRLLSHDMLAQFRANRSRPLPLTARVMRRIRRNIERQAIHKSGLFDADWYRGHYPDLENISDPLAHYLSYGAGEGRNPSQDFNTINYMIGHLEIVGSGVNPLYHSIVNSPERQ